MVNKESHQDHMVSIIIATLNAEKYLKNALDSIDQQSYKNYEVLIVDGGSTDNTIEIASSFSKVRIINQKSKGLFDAWNEGITLASGQYIAFLDSDDFWNKDALSEHMNALLAEPNLIGSVGRMNFLLEKDQTPPAEFKMSLLNESHLAYMPGCFVGKKEIFDKLGLFETHWKIASDIVWFSKVKDLKEGIVLLNSVVLNKRVHNKNLSYSAAKDDTYSKELLMLLRNKLNQRNS
jgi:glycosyltransferase involved in cell wall biosynthesis